VGAVFGAVEHATATRIVERTTVFFIMVRWKDGLVADGQWA
jgi:hypothetical protein